jgi:hypothetical protein
MDYKIPIINKYYFKICFKFLWKQYTDARCVVGLDKWLPIYDTFPIPKKLIEEKDKNIDPHIETVPWFAFMFRMAESYTNINNINNKSYFKVSAEKLMELMELFTYKLIRKMYADIILYMTIWKLVESYLLISTKKYWKSII